MLMELFKDRSTMSIPDIYLAISISLENENNLNIFIDKLAHIGIKDINIITPKYENLTYIEIATVKNDKNWYLDDALKKMFSQIDHCIIELKSLIDEYKGKVCIDIAFYHYDSFPALEFFGDNMKKIRFLEADISIDAY